MTNAAEFTDWSVRNKFRSESSRGAVVDNATSEIVTLLLCGVVDTPAGTQGFRPSWWPW